MSWAAIAIGAGMAAHQLYESKRSRDALKAYKEDTLQEAREHATHGIRWRADDARAAGIHPLAALGSPGQSYTAPAFEGRPNMADDWKEFGGQLKDFANKKLNAEEKEVSMRILRARASQEESKAAVDKKNMDDLLKGANHGNPTPDNSVVVDTKMFKHPDMNYKSNDWIASDDMPGQKKYGYDPEPKPMLKVHKMPGGKAILGPENPDMIESDKVAGFHYYKEVVKNFVEQRKAFNVYPKWSKKARKLRKELFNHRPAKEFKGWEYRYSVYDAQWIHTKMERVTKGKFKGWYISKLYHDKSYKDARKAIFHGDHNLSQRFFGQWKKGSGKARIKDGFIDRKYTKQ